MKKLFTLLFLALAVVSTSYSQVKKVPRNSIRPKAEQMRKISRTESSQVMQNVHAETVMTRTIGNAIDQTWYDWQSNDGARTWTHVWDNGKVDFAFTQSTDDSPFSSRGTGIVTYDSNTGEWSSMGGRVENEKTGFGSIAQYGQNGLVVAAHTASDCRVYVTEDRDAVTAGSMSVTSVLDNTYEPCWPNVMTTGANRDIIHVIATASSTSNLILDGVTDPLIYFRSLDGGQTWDKQNVILPYMGKEYSVDWTSNCAHWMETTDDNRLTLVVNNAWSDGFVLYSDDNGETWERKVFYSHPNIHGVDSSGWFFYPRWVSAVWDDDQLKLAYEWNGCTGAPGSGSYYPGIGGVAFWGENLVYGADGAAQSAIPGNLVPGQPFIMDTAYLYEDLYSSMWWWSDANHPMWPEYMGYLTTLTDEGQVEPYWEATEMNFIVGEGTNLGEHGHYNQGICAMPVLCKVPDSDGLVAVWVALDENCTDGAGLFYYHLFANYSPDGGLTWGNMVALCGGDDYWSYENTEMVFPQAAIIGDQLIVVVQVDEGTGAYVQSDDANGQDNYYTGYVYNLSELFNGTPPTTTYSISASVSPANSGTVTGAGNYAQGSTCTLKATANSGYAFEKWTKNGTTVSTNANYSFTVTASGSYVAHFVSTVNTYDITASVSPANSGTVAGAGTYASGSTCTLKATAKSGYTFEKWTKNGTTVSTNANYSFTVTASGAYVAHFLPETTQYTIMASVNPLFSGTVTGAGTYNSGSTCTLKATANSGYNFVNWTKNGTQVSTNAEYSFTVTANGSYVANFEPIQYTITASASPATGGSVSGDGSYPAGETCTLVAQPNSGYVFEKWTENGNFVSNESAYSFTVTEDASYVAHFIESVGSYTVTAIAVPSEGGSVTGGGTYNQGATCSLKATANAGYTFVKWTEADGTLVSTDVNYTFTVTDNVIYIAVFEQNISLYTITANASPAEGGMVSGGGEYEEGAQCTLTATAFSGYRFENWTENGTVVFTQTEYSFVVNGSRTLTAVFVPIAQYTITASSSSHGSILPEGTVQVTAGEDRTFTMMPDEGYKVGSVIVDGEDVGAVETYTFRNVNGNHSIHAQFVHLGVNDLYRPELKLYPNPASSSLTIVGEDMRRVTMMDLMGGQLEDREVSCDGMTWPLDSYASGTYIVKVEFKDGYVAFSRFVVVK